MRRSAQVAAPLLAAAALSLLTGCRTPEMQRCVDEHNNVVADSFCKDQPSQQHRTGAFIPFYRYYYGGWGGYGLGSQVGGGSYTPITGRSYSTTRGGFGSSFGGGGEGHGGGGAGE
jgi:hypothetical protein